MIVEINYFDQVSETRKYLSGGYYRHSETKLMRTESLDGESEIEIFENFYKKNNRLRYCNGSYYKFMTQEYQDKYNEWLQSNDYKSKSFALYYGEGIVD